MARKVIVRLAVSCLNQVSGLMSPIALVIASALVLSAPIARAARKTVEVDWRKAGMPAALKEASSSHKPLLVYWGAVWCPPCNALKAKAFHNPDFVKATESFIPVYLDGDSDEAQIWGERLKVSGYPTLLVLNSEGQEVQRLVADDPLPDLIRELKGTRDDLSSWDDLLSKATAESGSLSDDSWKRLARHEWLNDERWRDRESELGEKLAALRAVFPKKLKSEFERLRLQEMSARAQSLKEGQTLSTDEVASWEKDLNEILSSPSSVKNNLLLLAGNADSFVKALYPGKAKDSRRDAFIQVYLKQIRALLPSRSLSSDQRLSVNFAISALSSGANPIYPDLKKGEAKKLKASLDQELKAANTEEKIHNVLGTLADVYQNLGFGAEAIAKVKSYLPQVKVKNELMSILANLEKKQGHDDEYVKWAEEAYREAKGGATALQWGVGYVKVLTVKRAEEHERIQNASRDLIAQALKRSDCFSGRSWRSMDKLGKVLKEWSEKQKFAADLKVLLPQGLDCKKAAIGEGSQERCEQFSKALAAVAKREG